MAAISDKAMNKLSSAYKFNGGDEMEESISMYSTFYRGYDQQLGRFMGVDMLSEKAAAMNAYQFGANNPITFNDPLGDRLKDPSERLDLGPLGPYNPFGAAMDNLDYQAGYAASMMALNEIGQMGGGGGGSGGLTNGARFELSSAIYNNMFNAGGKFGNPTPIIDAINGLVAKGYTITDINYNGFRKGLTGAMIGFNGGNYSNPIIGADFVATSQFGVGSGPGEKSSSGFPSATAAGTLFSTSSFMIHNDVGWYSLKQNKFYSTIFNGNKFTGGRLKFAGTASKILERAGWAMGVWNGYEIINQYQNDEMGAGQMVVEQGVNAYATFGGVYGAAAGVGWELGRAITKIPWYRANVRPWVQISLGIIPDYQ